jgi:zeta-carotene desaturase
LSHLRTVPITGIHLWFDREVTALEHASLLDRNIQWMFQKSKILTSKSGETGSYLELVVSSSRRLLETGRAEIIELALKELKEFFPAAREAKLVKATVIKEVHATFAPAPGSDAFRLRPESAWPKLFLSGDWTATGWPSTMEGAVRSGYQTAESLCKAAGDARRFVVADLKPQGFMRMFRP